MCLLLHQGSRFEGVRISSWHDISAPTYPRSTLARKDISAQTHFRANTFPHKDISAHYTTAPTLTQKLIFFLFTSSFYNFINNIIIEEKKCNCDLNSTAR